MNENLEKINKLLARKNVNNNLKPKIQGFTIRNSMIQWIYKDRRNLNGDL